LNWVQSNIEATNAWYEAHDPRMLLRWFWVVFAFLRDAAIACRMDGWYGMVWDTI
jgi:hypothetical protein